MRTVLLLPLSVVIVGAALAAPGPGMRKSEEELADLGLGDEELANLLSLSVEEQGLIV